MIKKIMSLFKKINDSKYIEYTYDRFTIKIHKSIYKEFTSLIDSLITLGKMLDFVVYAAGNEKKYIDIVFDKGLCSSRLRIILNSKKIVKDLYFIEERDIMWSFINDNNWLEVLKKSYKYIAESSWS